MKKLALALAGVLAAVAMTDVAKAAGTFANPVASVANDPWVIQYNGMYYYSAVDDARKNVYVTGSQSLVDVMKQPWVTPVFVPPQGTNHSAEYWAPELHRIDNAWYIYVAADDGNNANHRMQVLRRTAEDPRGPFQYVGQLNLGDNKWAIDGTMTEINGKLYHIWSGWPGNVDGAQNLYISAMSDPVTAAGPRVRISTPLYPWERVGSPLINEGPTVFQHDGKTFMIYSASGSWTDSYCIGLMELTGDDPMNADDWTKFPTPWFQGGNGVVSPGHASVTQSPDGTEWWLAYHSARAPGAGWDRVGNLQQFTFDPVTGLPVIGSPVAPGVQMPLPSGSVPEPAHFALIVLAGMAFFERRRVIAPRV